MSYSFSMARHGSTWGERIAFVAVPLALIIGGAAIIFFFGLGISIAGAHERVHAHVQHAVVRLPARTSVFDLLHDFWFQIFVFGVILLAIWGVLEEKWPQYFRIRWW